MPPCCCDLSNIPLILGAGGCNLSEERPNLSFFWPDKLCSALLNKRTLLFFLLFLLSIGDTAAQPGEVSDHSTPAEVDQMLDEAEAATSAVDAIEGAKAALKLAKDLHFSGGERRAVHLLGKKCAASGDSRQALRYLLEAVNFYKASGQTRQLAEVYSAIGDIYFSEKLFDKSLGFYRDAAALRSGEPAALEKIGDSFSQNLKPDSARTYYALVLADAQKRGDLTGQIRLHQKLADAYGRFPDTTRMAQKTLNYLLAMRRLVELTGDKNAETVLFNNIAVQYTRMQEYALAVEYFQKVELQCGYISCDKGLLFTNLGIALHNAGRSREGIAYLLRAAKALADEGYREELPHVEHLIARTYLSMGDTYNSLSHNEKAMNMAAEQGQQAVLAHTYRTEAELYSMLFDFEKALEFFRKYLDLQDKIRLDDIARRQRMEQQQFVLQTSEKEYRLLLEEQKVQDEVVKQLKLEKEKTDLSNRALALENQRAEAEALALLKEKDLNEAKLQAKGLEVLRISAEARAAAQNVSILKQERQLTALRQKEEVQRLQLKQAEAEQLVREQENERLKNEQRYESEKQASFKKFVRGIGAAGAVIGGLLLAGFFLSRRANRALAQQKREVEKQRQESDRLLNAILPEEVAAELKATGAATPRHFDEVTILFTDFVNFTQQTEKMSAAALLDELNACFVAFDEIAGRNRLEKIKTIGDSYMAAAGAPVENQTHATDSVRAALEMMSFLEKHNAERPDGVGWQMRIGIHTGPVVAGVVGKNKFAWDIWGDAVNTAARLEQSGEGGRVNISGATFERVRHAFRCRHRGSIEAKHKGEIGMYFVEGELRG